MTIGHIGGLGDCGVNPCGGWDWLWVSNECAGYLACGAGEAAGAVVGDAASGIGQGIGSGIAGAATGAAQNINFSGLALLTVGALALYAFAFKR
jgi:hypothetical protein